jgi:predicted  nucleic acid-binding Zn-ribbon protein
MERSTLEEKKTSVEQVFNALQEEKSNLQSKISDIDTECLKLSGEFRLINEQLDNWVDKQIEGEIVNGRRNSPYQQVMLRL